MGSDNSLTVIYRFEFIDELEQLRFEQFIKPVAEIKDVHVLKDTSALYESDAHFRKLCMAEKAAKRAKSDYIYNKLQKL